MAGTYYEILGIPKNASDREIKLAYRTLARKYHPDLCREPGAEDLFKGINEAFRVLSNPVERTRYDTVGHDRYRRSPREEPGSGSVEDLRSRFRGFDDIFDLFFSERLWGSPKNVRPRSVSDILVRIEISFEEAILGTEREIEVSHTERCGACGGTGSSTGRARVCPRCSGAGTVAGAAGEAEGPGAVPCGECGGRGRIPGVTCPSCDGWGVCQVGRRVTLRIPPGIDSGMRIRREGLGEAGDREVPAGDLYVEVAVLPFPGFTRHGRDLETTLHLSPARAALGTDTEVATPGGRVVRVRVPPGTQHDATVRVAGEGVRAGGGSGDLLVRVKVDIPAGITHEERGLYERLSRIEEEKAQRGKGSLLARYLGRMRGG